MIILCYHRVLPEDDRAGSPFPSLAVTPEIFDAQMRWLSRHYRCLTLRDAVEERRRGKLHDLPAAVVTFDDGYRDNATFAAPVLRQHGVPATFFAISRLVDTDESPWYDRLARAIRKLESIDVEHTPPCEGPKEPRRWLQERLSSVSHDPARTIVAEAKELDAAFRREVVACAVELASVRPSNGTPDHADAIMSSQQLRELAHQGHEIGSHTRTHPILPRLAPAEIDEELAGSCADLSAVMGQPIVSLAYPNGDFNEVVVSKARNAGIRQAVTTLPGLNDPHRDVMRLRRVFVAQERLVGGSDRPSDALFALELTGAGDKLFLREARRGGTERPSANGVSP
ncbi:MAG: polysaccharide deacetylase family protein [Phycisphaerae bacterium]|nr:polysaccharide deacetylase family protein [Phycisphaerae bacterium]